jgi:glycosyltransferase involved in cell wall biosynthesis
LKLLFYSYSTTSYGAPTSMLNLLEGLTKETHIEVSVIVAKKGPLLQKLAQLPVRIIVLPHYKWIYKSALKKQKARQSTLLASIWWYKNLLQKLLLNVLFFPLHLFYVWKINPDVIYVNASVSPVGIIVGRVLDKKTIWHHREPLNDNATDFFVEWGDRWMRRILNWPAIRIYNSNFLKQMYSPYITTGSSFVVYNGVPVSASSDKPPVSNIVRYGMVGKIEPGIRKGSEEVIHIFNNLTHRNIVLKIFGDGEPSFVAKLRKSAGEKIAFEGFQSVDAIFSQIDFLIMNSRNESFGRVVAEAFAYGVPVLALNSGALPELVAHGKTGFIYDDIEDLPALIAKSQQIYNGDEYIRMSNNCRQKYAESFTISIYTRNILNLVEKL